MSNATRKKPIDPDYDEETDDRPPNERVTPLPSSVQASASESKRRQAARPKKMEVPRRWMPLE